MTTEEKLKVLEADAEALVERGRQLNKERDELWKQMKTVSLAVFRMRVVQMKEQNRDVKLVEEVERRHPHLISAVGRVTKVNRTRALVDFGGREWSVEFHNLTAVEVTTPA